MQTTRRELLQYAAAGALTFGLHDSSEARERPVPDPDDRVFITNEESNTVVVIDPLRNVVEHTINLTSFDEDPRPPFRYVTGGIAPPHAAMIHKPLYRGCIDAHGAMASPDGRLLATTGRGSSNVYLIDTRRRRVIGNSANPLAGPTTTAERLSGGLLLGREPHEPTFTPDGRELWVALRGENRIAILDVELARRQLAGEPVAAIRQFLPTIDGVSQVWFNRSGSEAFVASQRRAQLEVIEVGMRAGGSHPRRLALIDLVAEDPAGFTPFLKTTADGSELWMSHKLADAVSSRSTSGGYESRDRIPLGDGARPNHVEFVDNARGSVTYVTLARVDDRADGAACSRIAVVDRARPPGSRRVVHSFASHGREAHGLWTNPENTLLYVAHEQDELPGTEHAGQTVCTAFDVRNPFEPRLLARIPLGHLDLPSGPLRNKRSINLVYVRQGTGGRAA